MDEKFLKKMFSAPRAPKIEFGLKEVSVEARRMAGRLSISGVQTKLSVRLDKKHNILIPSAEAGEYILKPPVSSFENMPGNEQCCMDIAEELGIDVPPHCLLPLGDGIPAYIVKRFDRAKGAKIHQEDFCQALGAEDKYGGSAEQICRLLKEISSAPGLDSQLFFERAVFNFIIGNGDAHLKNYSILHQKNGAVRLAPAYDMVCSKLVIEDEEDSALSINGKKNRLGRKDFDVLADYAGMPAKIRYEKFEESFKVFKEIIARSALDEESRARFAAIAAERLRRLGLRAG